jgi:hypothetical protein
MAYLIERKSQTIFVTATSIIAKGKPREMIVESRPEYAVVRLAGLPEGLPVPWEEVYATAKKRHDSNLQLERAGHQKRSRSTRSKPKLSNSSQSHTGRRTVQPDVHG